MTHQAFPLVARSGVEPLGVVVPKHVECGLGGTVTVQHLQQDRSWQCRISNYNTYISYSRIVGGKWTLWLYLDKYTLLPWQLHTVTMTTTHIMNSEPVIISYKVMNRIFTTSHGLITGSLSAKFWRARYNTAGLENKAYVIYTIAMR